MFGKALLETSGRCERPDVPSDCQKPQKEIAMQLTRQDTIIRERAYAIWEREGRPDGREWDHWVQAASELQGSATAIAITAQQSSARPSGRKKTGSRGKLRLALKA